MIPHPSTTSSLGRVHDRGDAYTNIHRSHSSIELGSTDIPQSSDLDLFQNHLLDEPEDSILHEPSPHPGLPTFSQDVFGVLGEVLAASSSRPLFNGIHRSSTDTAVLNGLHQTHLAKGRSRDQAMVRPQKRPRSGSAHLSTGVQLGIQDSHLSTDPTAQTPLTRDAGLRQPGQHGLDRWTGHQLEDGLSQDVLRSGRVQKRVVTDDKEESGTSCRTFRVGSRSNDDSCIRAVSAFFGRVTGLRKSHPCLLRHQPQILPPRVILTNRRLGQWFDRIADITVPLQKSTRVIPRDLRSRTLLDKCVARKVPVARVVWLVRCMSPSELSDRHGGALSEDIVNPERRLEWIRGWTAAVQGLVDDQIKEENLAEHKSALVYR